MITDEVHVIDEEVRSTTAADVANKQEEQRKLSWPSLARI